MAMLLVKVAVNAAISYGLGLLARSIAGTETVKQEGSRLSEMQITSSTEGSTIKRLWGTTRVGGQIVWATKFKETKTTESEEVGGKGGGGGQEVETTTYTYSCSFAIALCEGSNKTQLGRIWIDGKLLDQSKHTIRFYPGSEDQLPDPFIELKEGADRVPAFRGVAYLVFEEMDLTDYGNRIPQVSAEITRPIEGEGGLLEDLAKAWCVIPSAGEYVYGTRVYMEDDGKGNATALNVHNSLNKPNAIVSMDQLEALAPNTGSILLVVSWFADSLDIATCTIRPKIEAEGGKSVIPTNWRVSDRTYANAEVVSTYNGGPAFGGTPADVTVREMVQNLQARGLRVIFYPFIMVDQPGNEVTWEEFYSTWTADGIAGGTTYHGCPLPADAFTLAMDEVVINLPVAGAYTLLNDAGTTPYTNPFQPILLESNPGRVRLTIERSTGESEPTEEDEIETALQTTGTIITMNQYNWVTEAYEVVTYTIVSSGTIRPPGSVAAGKARFYWVDIEVVDAFVEGYPWRGRITCSDGARDTAAAIPEVEAFVGTVNNGDFDAWNGSVVPYSGPSEWSYRRMILHYAHLLGDLLTGNDAFIIGSEMVGATTIRSNTAGAFPFVDALVDLAADVRVPLAGAVKISYAADWTEYNNYRPNDGSGDVYFHLDPLWASDDIDFVGLDAYFPLSDWRDGTAHLDYDEAAGITNPYVSQYLSANIEGGELYDWYYASQSDRDNQVRTPIVDTAEGKHWVFRQKDIRNWWEHSHYNRPNGVESGTPTAWTPKMKPFWFTEFGCPAVDKGANQPNVFVDPKSSESFVPYYSNGERDDFMQRRYLEEMLQYWYTGSGSDEYHLTEEEIEIFDGMNSITPDPITKIYVPAYDWTIEFGGGDPYYLYYAQSWLFMTAEESGLGATFQFQVHVNRNELVTQPDGEAAFLAAIGGSPWPDEEGVTMHIYTDAGGPDRPFVFFNCVIQTTDPTEYFGGGDLDDAYRFNFAHYSSDYGGELPDEQVVRTDDMHIWCWDARPYPEFPFRDDVWTDGANWTLGHWLNGRLGSAPLAELVRQLCLLGGVADEHIDVTGLYSANAVVRGYLVEDIKDPRAMIQDLAIGYSFDGYESGGKLTFNFRANNAVVSLELDDLVVSGDNASGYSITRGQETELPGVLKLSFIDEENDYNVGGADARTALGYSKSVHALSLPLVLPQEYVRALGDTIIQEAWLQRETAQFTVPRSLIRVDPSDLIEVTIKDRAMAFRVGETDTGDARILDAIAHDGTIYDTVNYSGRRSNTRGSTVYGRSKLLIMDVPIASQGEKSHHAPRLAAYANPWPGAVNLFMEDGAGGYKLRNSVRTPAIMGELAFDLYSGPLYRWDNVNSVFFDLYDPTATLTGTTEQAVLSGANSIAVQNQNGDWEVIQFVNADLIDAGRYQLTQLLRGQLGTERAMLSPIEAGAPIVLLDRTTINVMSLKEAEVAQPWDFRFGPAPLAVSDSRYTAQTFEPTGVGLRPYSPVSLMGTWDYASGDISMSWIRRTRFGGDNWQANEVPLHEESEKYEVDVMNGSTVVRTFTVNAATTKVYTAAQQTTDFGGLQTSLKFRVYQISAVYGRGSRAEATVYA